MANDDSTSGLGILSKLDPSLTQSSTTKTRKKDEIGKEEFLSMLVTQLKNQDPLDPISNDRFAVDLAQFSQLEQLMNINKALSGSGDVSSMASYLGQEVVFKQTKVEVANGTGSGVGFDLDSKALNVMLELRDDSGKTVDTISLGEREAGRYNVALNDLSAADGEYSVVVTVQNEQGQISHPEASIGGIVSGFIPGENPMLIVNGEEISPDDIQEVRAVLGA